MDGNVIIKAVLDTVDVSKNIKALERDLQGISWKNITEGDEKAAKLSSSFKKAGTAATVTLTAPVVAAGKAVFGVASDYEQANARIAAAFDVSGEEAERFSGIGKRIYEGGWGQSLDEVNDALIQCKSTLRDVSDEDLQTVTTNALMLSDTFGADVNESIRGTNALMEGFGLSATEASDLLTAGMQRGLNYTDELGDNLSEYSVRWGEAGMSASEYFSLLEAGTSNGAYNLDKVGDYLNEFLTALSDGRMEESIGSFSEGTQEVFENFKNGSATAEDMLQAVLGDITQMPNEYDKAALASTLWSSLGEDNAMGMIESLAGVQDSFGDVAGAAQQAQEAASDSFAVKSQEAMRELQGSIEPLGEPLLNIATNVADVVKSFSEWFAGIGEDGQTAVLAIATIAAAIGPVLSTVGTVVGTVPKIGAAFQVVGKLGTGALGLIAKHPVVAAIAAIIAAVVLLWNNCEEFRDAVTAVWDAVCAAFEVATQVAGDVAQSVGEFFSQLGETLGGVWDGICSTVQGAIDAIAGFFQGLAGTASSIWDGISSAIGAAIDVISSTISVVLSVIQAVWDSIWGAVSSTASSVWDGISSAIGAAIDVISSTISVVLSVIQAVWDSIWGAVSSTASSVWDGISSAIGAAIDVISSTISVVLSVIQAVWDSIWGAVSSTASSVWDGISSTISSIVNGIRDTITSVFNAAKDTVSSVWNSIKSAIETPIQNARDTVRKVIDSIKGFFNFSWSLPHLKLPHLSISGSFSIDPPSVPHFGIDWYAKGGVFNGPSVIGVGEAGPEGVVPFNERGARPLAEGIAKLLDGKGGAAHGDTNVTINLYATVREEADIEKISRQIAKEIKRQECFA
jgi:TP901 family phage tail tape measure protein